MARDSFDKEAYTADYFAQYDSTIANGEARIPICFCIDTSSSMKFVTNDKSDYRVVQMLDDPQDGYKGVGTIEPLPGKVLHHRIDEVRRVLLDMINKIRVNKRIANAAVINIITFDLFADCIIEFSEARRISPAVINKIKTHEDKTNASKGINMALERLDQFQHVNSAAGNESYRPVLVFMSDGNVSQDPGSKAAAKEVRKRSDEGKLNVIPIGIGSEADETWLRGLTRDAKVFHMNRERDFDEVFSIIANRIAKTTMVIPADEGLGSSNGDRDRIGRGNDEGSTRYGEDTSVEDILKFLGEFVNT